MYPHIWAYESGKESGYKMVLYVHVAHSGSAWYTDVHSRWYRNQLHHCTCRENSLKRAWDAPNLENVTWMTVKLYLRDGRTDGQRNTSLRWNLTRMNERTDGQRHARPQRTNNVHHDRRRHAVSTSLRLVDRIKTDGRANERTDAGIEFGAF